MTPKILLCSLTLLFLSVMAWADDQPRSRIALSDFLLLNQAALGGDRDEASSIAIDKLITFYETGFTLVCETEGPRDVGGTTFDSCTQALISVTALHFPDTQEDPKPEEEDPWDVGGTGIDWLNALEIPEAIALPSIKPDQNILLFSEIVLALSASGSLIYAWDEGFLASPEKFFTEVKVRRNLSFKNNELAARVSIPKNTASGELITLFQDLKLTGKLNRVSNKTGITKDLLSRLGNPRKGLGRLLQRLGEGAAAGLGRLLGRLLKD